MRLDAGHAAARLSKTLTGIVQFRGKRRILGLDDAAFGLAADIEEEPPRQDLRNRLSKPLAHERDLAFEVLRERCRGPFLREAARRLFDGRLQGVQARAAIRLDRHDRHAEVLLQASHVDLQSQMFGDIEHVECDDDRNAQLEHLGCQE